MAEAEFRQQLQMLLPESVLASPPQAVAPDGYRTRTFEPGDEAGHIAVMRSATFDGWNEEQLRAALLKTLPDGMFLSVHEGSGAIVGTAAATHNPAEHHPFGGELGWVAVTPEHRGHGLGRAVCAAAIQRLADAGHVPGCLVRDEAPVVQLAGVFLLVRVDGGSGQVVPDAPTADRPRPLPVPGP